MLFKGGIHQYSQPYIRSTGSLYETPHTFRAAPSRANKGGHHGCTPEQAWIWNIFAFYLFEIEELLECSAKLKVLGSSSTSTEYKDTPKSSWLSSLEDALEDWGRELSCWGLLSGSLLRDLDLANSLEGKRGELERRGFHAEGIVGGFEEEFVGVFFGGGPMEVMIGVPVVKIV